MSLPFYTTSDVVFGRVASVLGQTVANLTAQNPNWVNICGNATNSENGKIHRVLLSRRWTPDQILADPTIPELASRIGCCHALREGAITREGFLDKIKEYCLCEKDLADYLIVDDTQEQPPAGPSAVSYGNLTIADQVRSQWGRWGC